MLLEMGLGAIIIIGILMIKLEKRVKALEEKKKDNATSTPSPYDLSRQPTLRQFIERNKR